VRAIFQNDGNKWRKGWDSCHLSSLIDLGNGDGWWGIIADVLALILAGRTIKNTWKSRCRRWMVDRLDLIARLTEPVRTVSESTDRIMKDSGAAGRFLFEKSMKHAILSIMNGCLYPIRAKAQFNGRPPVCVKL
jgi:hypothetical protein